MTVHYNVRIVILSQPCEYDLDPNSSAAVPMVLIRGFVDNIVFLALTNPNSYTTLTLNLTLNFFS